MLGWVAMLVGLWTVSTAQCQVLFDREINDDGSSLKIGCPFATFGSPGTIPLSVTFRNGGRETATLVLEFTIGPGEKVEFSTSIPAEAGKRVTHQLVIPNPGADGGLSLEWSLRDRKEKAGILGYVANSQSVDAVSESLDRSGFSSRISYAAFGYGGRRVERIYRRVEFENLFYPEYAPRDWRGYAGISKLLLQASDWNLLSELQQDALMDWVHLGGDLVFADQMPEASESFRRHLGPSWQNQIVDPTTNPTTKVRIAIGAGRVQPYLERPPTLVERRLIDEPDLAEINSHWRPKTQNIGSNPSPSRPSFRPEFPLWLLTFLSFSVAVILGPFNLLSFARGAKRYRMLVTTPVLAVVSGIFILLAVIIVDGIGMKGERVALIELVPEEGKLYVTQWHYTIGGLLLSNGFDEPDTAKGPTVIVPTTPRHQQADGFHHPSLTRYLNGRVLGDWFASRKQSRHLVRSVRSTRARVEFEKGSGDVAPTVHSSLGLDLIEFFLIDAEGRHWKTPDGLRKGEKATLIPAEEPDSKFFESIATDFYPRSLPVFCGKSNDHSFELVELVPTDWEQDLRFIYGSVNEIGAPSRVPQREKEEP